MERVTTPMGQIVTIVLRAGGIQSLRLQKVPGSTTKRARLDGYAQERWSASELRKDNEPSVASH